MNLKVKAPLDPQFLPMSVFWRDYERDAAGYPGTQTVTVNVERDHGYCDYLKVQVFPEGVERERTLLLLDRLVKTLLWTRGGWKITVHAAPWIENYFASVYGEGGAREFDRQCMSTVYGKPFTVAFASDPKEIAVRRDGASKVGRHLNGCRIGFDAGGSDRKVSAVIDGESVYSEEVVWFPKINSDPQYHIDGILSAFKTAAAHMPRVDGIGVSSAGVYIDNCTMVASLFNAVPKDQFESVVKTIYTDVARQLGPDIPLVVANDGDVTALAGAMDMNKGNVLGIAMGTSEAGGYVDQDMRLMGWLTELAFVPVDVNREAMADEWSGDIGVGVKYFSQDAVIKLANAGGIELDASLSPAEKLKVVQNALSQGNEGAKKIFETIGVYFGYAIAYYARFYEIEHVLIMGRVTSGEGGPIILNAAKDVLRAEFPDLAEKIALHIPDEKSRRVGQSVAAASLPEVCI